MQDWTYDEKQKHEKGRALMQSARDLRRNRIEAEKRAKQRDAEAQQRADRLAEQKRDDNIAAFMSGLAGLLRTYNLSLMPIEPVSFLRNDMPIFKLADRTTYKTPEYVVSVRPGVGFNWKK